MSKVLQSFKGYRTSGVKGRRDSRVPCEVHGFQRSKMSKVLKSFKGSRTLSVYDDDDNDDNDDGDDDDDDENRSSCIFSA